MDTFRPVPVTTHVKIRPILLKTSEKVVLIIVQRQTVIKLPGHKE